MAKAKKPAGEERKIQLNKGKKKRTSIGKRAKPKNKHARKKSGKHGYRGQGK